MTSLLVTLRQSIIRATSCHDLEIFSIQELENFFHSQGRNPEVFEMRKTFLSEQEVLKLEIFILLYLVFE